MNRNLLQNIKQDICSIYFVASVMLVVGICLLSPGIGALDYSYISRPAIVEELLGHNQQEFLGFSELYNYESIFGLGIGGLLYTVLPLLSMASVSRYCEEKTSGYWIQKTVRSGRRPGTAGNLISSAVTGVLAILGGSALFMAFIVLRLPDQRFEIAVFLSRLLFMCLLTALGAFLSVLVAAVTMSKFYSFVIPVLLFYAENEFLMGAAGGIYLDFSVKGLMNPDNKAIGFCFIVIVSFLLCTAVDQTEKGRYGIGV